jgi:ABC-type branched-subunit amino acid transport system ATPase component
MMLQIRNLTGGYTKDHNILQGVNLEVSKNESVGIIGLNGSGKSSLAKAILNILPCRQGEILLNGIDISKNNSKELSELGIALFMQGGRVFDELSIWENLTISAKNFTEIDEIQKYFVSLRRFSKRDLAKIRADKLSGGERHQLALAMCMLKKPSLLILDEPSAGLAPNVVDDMYKTLSDLRKKENLTIILIEQNVSRAVDFCSSVNMLRDGKIECCFKGNTLNLKEIEKIMFN